MLTNGDIVHFVLNNGNHRPAVVTDAISDGVADLVVILNGHPEGKPEQLFLWVKQAKLDLAAGFHTFHPKEQIDTETILPVLFPKWFYTAYGVIKKIFSLTVGFLMTKGLVSVVLAAVLGASATTGYFMSRPTAQPTAVECVCRCGEADGCCSKPTGKCPCKDKCADKCCAACLDKTAKCNCSNCKIRCCTNCPGQNK